MSDMKWWGWGAPDVAFSDADKPALAPFLQRYLAVDPARPPSGPVPLSALTIPDPVLVPRLRAALEDAAGAPHVSLDAHDRILHARGKSLRDLVRHRSGD